MIACCQPAQYILCCDDHQHGAQQTYSVSNKLWKSKLKASPTVTIRVLSIGVVGVEPSTPNAPASTPKFYTDSSGILFVRSYLHVKFAHSTHLLYNYTLTAIYRPEGVLVDNCFHNDSSCSNRFITCARTLKMDRFVIVDHCKRVKWHYNTDFKLDCTTMYNHNYGMHHVKFIYHEHTLKMGLSNASTLKFCTPCRRASHTLPLGPL